MYIFNNWVIVNVSNRFKIGEKFKDVNSHTQLNESDSFKVQNNKQKSIDLRSEKCYFYRFIIETQANRSENDFHNKNASNSQGSNLLIFNK